MNLAKLNYVLIPGTLAERERWRTRRVGRAAERFYRLWQVLTRRGRAFFLVVLLVGGFGAEVATTQVYLLFSALLGVLVTAWLARGAFALHDVHVRARWPKRIAVGDDVRFRLGIENRSDDTWTSLRVRGPFLPWDGRWIGSAPLVEMLAPQGTQEVECQARFVARGQHHLDPFLVQALIPLGLTLGRPAISDPCSFLVVPRIAPVRRIDLPVTRRHQPGGVALASKTGESMDLLGVRDYRPGDPLRDLHARSWARLGRPVVREYQEECFTRIGVVIDIDIRRGNERQLEAGLSLAAGVVERLSRGEALIDLLVVGDQVHTLTLGRSLGFLDQALDLLACVEGTGQRFEASSTASRLAPHLGRLSCVVFLAMDWNEERHAFVQRVKDAGVVCRTIVVSPPVGKGESPIPTAVAHQTDAVTRVATEAIEKGEALCL